jgi:hypothetical protein
MNQKDTLSNSKFLKNNEEYLKAHYQLVKKRSITPDTHKIKEVEIFEDYSIYKDKYEYKGNSVIHFGINKQSELLVQEVLNHNKKPFVKDLLDLETKSNISKNTNKYEEYSKTINLIGVEKELMQTAVDFLVNDKQKTVLVDVFERAKEKTGLIDITKTHTVVLYNTGSKILVIDPNNPQFSSHLANFSGQIETTCTPNNLYKIYSRPDNTITGYAKVLWRDCVDIAVKLAFGFNMETEVYKSIDEVVKSKIVKLITNNRDIDQMMFKPQDLIRLKQSSDFDKILFCNEQMKKETEKIKIKVSIENELFEQAKKYLEKSHDFIVQSIMGEKDFFVESLKAEYNSDLLGNIEE